MAAKTDAEKAEMYRKQLGGTNAALREERQKSSELEEVFSYIWEIMLNEEERDWMLSQAPERIRKTIKKLRG